VETAASAACPERSRRVWASGASLPLHNARHPLLKSLPKEATGSQAQCSNIRDCDRIIPE